MIKPSDKGGVGTDIDPSKGLRKRKVVGNDDSRIVRNVNPDISILGIFPFSLPS